MYYCEFDGKPCSETHFKHKNTDCWTFNNGLNSSYYPIDVLTSKEPGYRNGLRLYLWNNNEDYQTDLYIHNHSSNIDTKKAIRVNKNLETSLILNRVYEKKLPAPYSDCQKEFSFESKPNDIVNSSPYPYFQSECYLLCHYKKELETCGYSKEFKENMSYYFTNRLYFYQDFYYPLINNCTSMNASLIDQVNALFEEKGQNKVCHDMCPIQCEAFTYKISTYTQWTGRDCAIVNIYYEELSYTSIREYPKITAYKLLGNIGGLLSLFLGISLITFGEFLEFLYKFHHIY